MMHNTLKYTLRHKRKGLINKIYESLKPKTNKANLIIC